MAYHKKDEDMDGAIVKVDRTSVFQEGTGSLKEGGQKHSS